MIQHRGATILVSKYSAKGFTLVELLFVVILLSILCLSVMKVITQVQAAKQNAEEIRTRVEIANRVFAELRTQFSSKGMGSVSQNGQQSQSNVSFVGGGARSIAYDTISQSKVLRLITIGTRYASPALPDLYGEVESRIFLEQGQNKLQKLVLELWAVSDNATNNQQNSSSNQSEEQGDIDSKQGVNAKPILRNILADNIKDLKFRFRQQQNWSNDINSNYGLSPNLIEATLVVGDESNPSISETYKSAFPFGPPQR